MTINRRELTRLNIASILDHPSVMMGGPSRVAIRKADRIMEYLEKEGLIRFDPTQD